MEKITFEPSSYPVVIFGDSMNDIEDAIKILDKILQDVYMSKSFKEDIIKEFGSSQVLNVFMLFLCKPIFHLVWYVYTI